jgi:alginate O-acetyltransferase complex protein AlgI
LYWFVFQKNLKAQNTLLLAASYVFYGWWDWRFLSLIAFSSIVDYLLAIQLGKEQAPSKRKFYLWTSLFVNLGLLGVFKYYDFFAASFADAFTLLGHHIEVSRLNIILPVGISFYTFQTLSYTIDVYRKELEPSRDPIAFFSFVSFFPQLVAGPIERASNLLPQFSVPRSFNEDAARDGMRQILWGLFKKVVIADNCAHMVNMIFDNHETQSPSMLVIGALLFTFQIYGDFSGYSDIAIGTARLFGFNLMQNFAFPYFSRDIAEFWRRWHISLSSWFKDYVYIPLGGSKGGLSNKVRNTFIIFLVSGLWHGANWTFIIWGLLNALYFLPLLLTSKNRRYTKDIAENSWLPSPREFMQISMTFVLTVFAWIIFRSESLSDSYLYISRMISGLISEPKQFLIMIDTLRMEPVFYYILIMIVFDWISRKEQHGLEGLAIKRRFFRWSIYYGLIVLIWIQEESAQNFIYFQF